MNITLEQKLTELGWQIRAWKTPNRQHQARLDPKNKIIWINYNLTAGQYKAALAHEYIHILLGHEGKQTKQVEQIVDRKAALLLISELEYAIAEQIVGEHAGAIAEYLEIPLWVILAWRKAKNIPTPPLPNQEN